MKDKKEMVTVPYIVYEKDIEHKNTVVKIMGTAILFLIIALICTVYMFMSFINSHDYKNYDQDGNGINNINEGTQRDVINESSSPEND